MSKQVLICLPSYKTMEPRMAFSVMGLIDRARTALMLDFGDAFIVHSRNKLADNFLKTGIEWCLTIDDDMIVPFGDATLFNSFTGFNLPERFAGLNTLDRLLSHGKTLVGALYFGRWSKGRAVYSESSDPAENDFARSGPHDTCKPTRWVGTGCLLIHRSVFLAIEKKFPHLARSQEKQSGGQWFTSSEHDLRIAAENATSLEQVKYALNVTKRNSSMGMGEDVQFCVRAAQAGHQPHVDLGCLCGHIGNYCYGKK